MPSTRRSKRSSGHDGAGTARGVDRERRDHLGGGAVRAPRRRRGGGRPRWAAGTAICVLAAAVLAGCTTARSSLGTSDSSCYLALPTATKAVESHGRLLGVQKFSLSALRKNAPHLLQDLATTAPGSETVCIVAFTGKFTSGSVSDRAAVRRVIWRWWSRRRRETISSARSSSPRHPCISATPTSVERTSTTGAVSRRGCS